MSTHDYISKMTKQERKRALSVLKKVRKLLNPKKGVYHWIRGHYSLYKIDPATGQGEQCYCLVGAINDVTRRNVPGFGPESDRAIKDNFLARNALVSVLPQVGKVGIIEWNDRKTRTVDDVLGKLDEAIEKLSAPDYHNEQRTDPPAHH